MQILKIELPRTQTPEFYCPFSGYNILGEDIYGAIDAEYLGLAVNWEDADEYIMGSEELLEKYKNFKGEEDETPTERVKHFLTFEGLENSCLVIELTVNAMACGPITEVNTYVFFN